MVISGSLFFFLACTSVDRPVRKHVISFENLFSLFHVKNTLGVVAATPGSLWLRSSAEALGALKVFCGMANSYVALPPQEPGFWVTTIC